MDAVVQDNREERRIARREAAAARKAQRPKVRKWRGLLANESRRTRVMLFVVIVVGMAALSFTQLGFLGVGLPDSYSGYCVTLLAFMAISALLFGLPLGTLSGVVAGALLLVHSLIQPLDYYEVNFITPLSSVVLFTLMGLLFSFLIALALRGNPSRVRAFVYIFIVCTVVSCLFSFLFMMHAFVKIVFDYIFIAVQSEADFSLDEVYANVFTSLSQMGGIGLQVCVDIVLMVVCSYVTYFIVERERATRDDRKLITTFRIWLFVAVSVVFMVTAAASFVVITEQSKSQAQQSMEGEIDYIKGQLTTHDDRIAKLNDFIQRDKVSIQGVSEEEEEELRSLVSIDTLLKGYDVADDGTIVIFDNGVVLLSDDENFKPGDKWDDYFEGSMLSYKYALNSNDLVQVAYSSQPAIDPSLFRDSELSEEELDELSATLDRRITTHMAFLRMGQYNDLGIMVMMPAAKVFAGRTAVMAWTALSAFVLLFAVFLMASRLLTQVVVRRIDETNGVLSEITEGNLDARVNVSDSREFKSLAKGINTTVSALKNWISEAESRMDQELATAKAIQESALPRTFPPYPDNAHFDIYASMKPAREVGGDFYDFFLIGDDSDTNSGKLGFVIADVSGKGVPAALFMMAAKTEVRNYLEHGVEPGEAIENANRQLCEGNDAGMFVTLFAGVLDYATGHVSYVNAGHNPPLIWQAGSWRWLKDISGMPLGLFDGFPYDTYELDMAIGDQLLLYTDGVTEAMSVSGELYGEERLEALAAERFMLHPRRLVLEVRQELARYTRGAEQSDDITMLALEYGVPPEVTATMVVQADVAELPHVNRFIHTELDRRLCPVKVQKQIDIALEELFVNVAHYAYPDTTPESQAKARISYTYSAEPPSVRVDIADGGVPYNPLEKPDAVTPDDIMEVPIGGLGILMAKNSVDEMTYEYVDHHNIVSFVKRW